MNRDELMGKWKQVRGRIKQQWGRLTEDELDEMEGDYEMLVGRIQERYGQSRDEVERSLEAILGGRPTAR